jgi:hypothetical protein
MGGSPRFQVEPGENERFYPHKISLELRNIVN